MPCGHLNAMRFAQKPLAQPAYSFVHVPKAESTLAHSSLQKITHREHFQTCMAEMLLLGKEAVRRRKQIDLLLLHGHNKDNAVTTNSGAKPLSLEYLADRLDIDDPCFGFLVRTKTPPPEDTLKSCDDPSTIHHDETNKSTLPLPSSVSNVPQSLSHWKQGMLQGFITVTTFTNWQKSFRWDSLHPEAYGYDPPALTKQRLAGIRQWDSDGTLAKELQQTVRCGDIWGEGVVWPRIAEISLLGGLGCGKVSFFCVNCDRVLGCLLFWLSHM